MTSGTAALPSLNHSARSPVPGSTGPSKTPPPIDLPHRSDARRRFASLGVPDSASDHVRITSCVCVVRCGRGLIPLYKANGGGRVFRGLLRPICRPNRRIRATGNADLPPLPTYQQHSAGSPAVEGALRPTPKGLTAGEAVLHLPWVGLA